ncbi:hypothetical protein TCAL_15523 [Tigriopus californicus]|uniref:Uncharacterized protein n=1 Tax=Tigriopus californicus TaxID=6832 RepID=A0A553PTK4_TIGCA|nr:hypothetical protein TCAL_15523 [Tigriopus californicus]
MWRWAMCHSTRSIRRGSFFYHSKLDLHTLIMFTYCWSRSWPLHDVSWECGVLAEGTLVDWANFHRDVCQQYLRDNRQQIGGIQINEDGEPEPAEVEIDESLITKAKYNRGRWPQTR